MNLLEKIQSAYALFRNALSVADNACAEKDKAIAERDNVIEGLRAQLDSVDDAIQAQIDAFTSVVANPTPGKDAIIEAADKSESENTPAVQEAIDNTVGTEAETSDEALQDALDMLTPFELGGEVSDESPISEPDASVNLGDLGSQVEEAGVSKEVAEDLSAEEE